MLGQREPEIYGSATLADIQARCADIAKQNGFAIDFKQSNHEGEIVTWIQNAIGHCDGIAINAAAYTHTSIAIHDALKLTGLPIAEIHLSEPKEREAFRHHSYIEPLAKVHVSGKGIESYTEALIELHALL